MAKLKIATEQISANKKYSITVTNNGPYLVHGQPPLTEEFIMPNEQGKSWYFQ